MILFTIAAILVVGTFIITFLSEKDFGIIDGILWGFLTSSFVSLLAFIVLFLASVFVPCQATYKKQSLTSLQDSVETEGSFFIGTGNIDGKPTYAYYVDHGNYSTFETVKARDVKVFTDASYPYVKLKTGCVSKYPWLAYCFTDTTSVEEIHVPEGTIKSNYNLDAK